jgi:hypothetical protein
MARKSPKSPSNSRTASLLRTNTWQGESPFIFKAPNFYESLQDPTNLKILSFDN